MKKEKIKFLVLVSFVLSIILSGNNAIYAMNTGLSTSEISDEEKSEFLSDRNLTLTYEETQGRAIECFDVSDDGFIAIGSQRFDERNISIYSPDGKFQYGYNYICDIRKAELQWDEKNIIIYLGDEAASFDPNGNNLEVRSIEQTDENNSYMNQVISARTKKKNGNEYTLRKSMGALGFITNEYSQLVKIDSNNNETVLYDVSSTANAKIIFVAIAVGGFAVFVIYRVKRYYAEEYDNQK